MYLYLLALTSLLNYQRHQKLHTLLLCIKNKRQFRTIQRNLTKIASMSIALCPDCVFVLFNVVMVTDFGQQYRPNFNADKRLRIVYTLYIFFTLHICATHMGTCSIFLATGNSALYSTNFLRSHCTITGIL